MNPKMKVWSFPPPFRSLFACWYCCMQGERFPEGADTLKLQFLCWKLKNLNNKNKDDGMNTGNNRNESNKD